MRSGVRWLISCCVVAAGCAASAPAADAYIYWGGNNYHVGLGRAALDGTDVNKDFIPAPAGQYAYIKGVASDGAHVYYGVHGAGTTQSVSFVPPAIWRANVDGSGAAAFSQSTGQTNTAIGVSASHVYWTAVSQDTSSVGRTPIVGGQQFQAIDSTFGEPNPQSCGVAADDKYLYFANMGTYSIGRAELATMGTPDQVVDGQWIKLPTGQKPCGLAVDGDSVYWGTFEEAKTNSNDYTGPPGRSVYRADKATGGGTTLISGDGFQVTGVAVLGDFVYFSNMAQFSKDGSIKRVAKKGGTTITMVSGLEATWGVAVDDGGTQPAPPAPAYYPPPYQAPITPPAVYCPSGCGSAAGSTAPPVRPDFTRVWYTKKTFSPAAWNTPISGLAVYTSASGARASARAARAGGASPSATAARAAAPRATSGTGGTVFNYQLGQDATMKIALSRISAGKLKAGACKKPTTRLRKAKKCDRLTLVSTLTRTSKAGTNAVAFSGRINDKAFKPGRYRAVFTPSTGSLAAAPRSVDFTITT